jgi:hypothetical protein
MAGGNGTKLSVSFEAKNQFSGANRIKIILYSRFNRLAIPY